jgi:hypothetical protein
MRTPLIEEAVQHHASGRSTRPEQQTFLTVEAELERTSSEQSPRTVTGQRTAHSCRKPSQAYLDHSIGGQQPTPPEGTMRAAVGASQSKQPAGSLSKSQCQDQGPEGAACGGTGLRIWSHQRRPGCHSSMAFAGRSLGCVVVVAGGWTAGQAANQWPRQARAARRTAHELSGLLRSISSAQAQQPCATVARSHCAAALRQLPRSWPPQAAEDSQRCLRA